MPRSASPIWIALLPLLSAVGCGWLHTATGPGPLPGAAGPPGAVGPAGPPGPSGLLGHDRRQPLPLIDNPLIVPAVNEDYLWSQIVDTVDDYFKIEREDRIRVTGGVVSEGRIETFPETGSGYLEPWRRDSTPGHEKLLATLQSIRRRALVRVAPGPDGYQIHVTVLKELEDVNQPEFSTVGGSALRHDGTVVRTTPIGGARTVTLGWIPIGRDPSLEQQMLYEMQARLSAPPPRRPPGHPGLLPR